MARELQLGGLSTFLVFHPLLGEEERVDQFSGELRFDIELLTRRVVGVTGWLQRNPETQSPAIGYFGAETQAGGGAGSGRSLRRSARRGQGRRPRAVVAPTWPWTRLPMWWRRLS